MSELKEILFELESPVVETRLAALRRLEKFRDIKAIPHVEKLLSDDNVEVRFHARRVLHLLKELDSSSREIIELIMDVPKEPEMAFQRLTSGTMQEKKEALTFFEQNEIDEPLKTKLKTFLKSSLPKEKDPFIKSRMLSLFKKYVSETDVTAELEQELASSDLRVVANAIELAGGLDRLYALKLISPFLDHHDNRVRANAARAIFPHNPQAALKTLDDMITSNKIYYKESAVWALMTLDGPEIPSLLYRALSLELLPKTTKAVLQYLKNKTGGLNVELLLKAISNPELSVESKNVIKNELEHLKVSLLQNVKKKQKLKYSLHYLFIGLAPAIILIVFSCFAPELVKLIKKESEQTGISSLPRPEPASRIHGFRGLEQTYFPLWRGSYWIYEDGTVFSATGPSYAGKIPVSVISRTDSKGSIILEHYISGKGGIILFALEKVSDETTGVEFLNQQLFPLPMEDGQAYPFEANGSQFVNRVEFIEEYEVPAGIFRKCVKVTTIDSRTGKTRYAVYAPMIGMIDGPRGRLVKYFISPPG